MWGREIRVQTDFRASMGALAVALALLISPEGEGDGMEAGLYGAPIVLGMTLVDPTMGEVKRKMRDLRLAIISGSSCFLLRVAWLSFLDWY